MSNTKFRGTRKKQRSTKGRRPTPAEKTARAAECKHEKFRFRNRSTETVCLECGAVRKIKGTGMNLEVVESWKLDAGEAQEHDDLCSCAVCHVRRQEETSMKERKVRKQLPSGTQLVAEERQRQINEEGWTSDHDDAHDKGELGLAAICYAAEGIGEPVYISNDTDGYSDDPGDYFKDPWPWSKKWDKRGKHSQLQCLIIAGALIAAEIDRLQRKLQQDGK